MPREWRTTTIGALASVSRGASPRPIASPRWFDVNSKVRWVRIADVNRANGRILRETTQALSDEGVARSRYLEPGTLIMSIAATVGIPIITGVPTCIHDGFVSLENLKVDTRFLLYLLKASEARLREAGQSGSQMNINSDIVRGLAVRIPDDRAEQERIASAFWDVDDLIESLERSVAKKRAIKRGLMQAVLGDSYRRTGIVTLGKCLARPPRYGIGAAAVGYQPTLPSYIRITDIDDDGRFSPRPRASVHSPLSGSYKLVVGDLVIARTGASVGKSYRYRVEDGELVFAGFLIAIHPDKRRLDPRYLAYILQSKAYWDWVASESTRSGQPGINARQLSQFPIGLPTIEGQREFTQRLADADAEIEALERRLEATRAIKEGMMQELLSGRTRLVAEATA